MSHAREIALVAVTAISIALAAPVLAQSYPTRAIRMVVGFPPGGFTDILARQIAERLVPSMGQQIVVDNRSGNAGIIGADIVAKAKPDGYTLLMGHNNSNAVAPSLYAKLPYDARKDFAPIALTGSVATVLVVHPSVPAKTVKELIAVATRTKGQLRVASSGVGSTQHLALERFKLATRTQMTHIPYKGSGQAVIDLIGGHVDANFDGIGVVLPYVRSGKAACPRRRHAAARPAASGGAHDERAGADGVRERVVVRGVRPGRHSSGSHRPLVHRAARTVGAA